jgi:hypothetical protein
VQPGRTEIEGKVELRAESVLGLDLEHALFGFTLLRGKKIGSVKRRRSNPCVDRAGWQCNSGSRRIRKVVDRHGTTRDCGGIETGSQRQLLPRGCELGFREDKGRTTVRKIRHCIKKIAARRPVSLDQQPGALGESLSAFLRLHGHRNVPGRGQKVPITQGCH